MTTNTIFTADENAIIEVQITDLNPDTLNPRRMKPSPGRIGEMADSIKARGQLKPIEIRPNGVIIDGECRFHALRMAGVETARVIVRDAGESQDVLADQLTANLMNNEMSPVDTADALARLRDDLGYAPAEISSLLGWSSDRVGRYLDAADLPPDGRAAFAAGKIALATASAIMEFEPRYREKAVGLAAKRPTAAKALDALAVYAKDISMPEADRKAALSAKEKKELRKGVARAKKLADGLTGKGADLVRAHKGRIEELVSAAKAMKVLAAEIESAAGKAQAQAEISRADDTPEAVETSEVKPAPKKKPAAAKKAA